MARFVALLMITPWLGVLSFLYWWYVRRSHTTPQLAHRDALIVVLAFAAAAAGAAIAWQEALGHGHAIWKYLAGPIGAYVGFNVIIGFGLLRHRLLVSRVQRHTQSPTARGDSAPRITAATSHHRPS